MGRKNLSNLYAPAIQDTFNISSKTSASGHMLRRLKLNPTVKKQKTRSWRNVVHLSGAAL